METETEETCQGVKTCMCALPSTILPAYHTTLVSIATPLAIVTNIHNASTGLNLMCALLMYVCMSHRVPCISKTGYRMCSPVHLHCGCFHVALH